MKFRNLVEVLEYRAKETPNNIAYTFLFDGEDKENNITYLELLNMSKAVAFELQKKYKKGDRVILGYSFGLDVIIAFYACLLAGIIPVPVPPPDTTKLSKSSSRLSSIISNCEPKAILTTTNIKSGMSVFAIVIPELREMDYISTDNIDIRHSLDFKKVEIKEENVAFLQYTSGSTSEPRGVIVTHRSLLANQEMLLNTFAYNGENNNCVSWIPFYHDMGLVGHIIHPLYVNGRSIIMEPGDFLEKPVRLLKAISNYRAFMSFSPNFAYDLCSMKVKDEEMKRYDVDLSSWKIAGNSSEPIRKDTLDRFYERFKNFGFSKKALFPAYGLAEATLIVSGKNINEEYKFLQASKSHIGNNIIASPSNENDSVFLVSSGKATINQEIKIVDAITLKECNEKELGEIWVNGENVADGYWNNLDETNRIFRHKIKSSPNKVYLRTGDVGFIDKNELYLVGRLKDIIIVNGKNIYPHDIERLIEAKVKEFPEIKLGSTAVFSLEINNKENLVLAMEIDPEKNHLFDINKLISAINKLLISEYQMSFYSMNFVKVGNLPKTSSGKLQRNLYKKIFDGNSEAKFNIDIIHKYSRNSSLTKNNLMDQSKNNVELKNWIVQWFISTLALKDVNDIEIDKSLLDFITDSLFIISFSNDLGIKLGRKIEQDFLYKYPTIRDILIFLS